MRLLKKEKGSATGALMTILLLVGFLTLGVKYFNFDEALAPFARKWESWLESGSLPTAGKLRSKAKGKEEGPQVAILYAHPGQCYGKPDLEGAGEIVEGGAELARALEEKGIGFRHEPQVHAVSYSEAEAAIGGIAEELKRQYPSLKVILDLHRDAAPEGLRPTYKLAVAKDGAQKQLARVQLLLPPDQSELGLMAGKIWSRAEEEYPGLIRGMLRTGGPQVLTVMMGDWQANTLEQAKASASLLGDLLAQVLD